ncbi:M81 family metallopeptidase [Microvirga pakistanensis]|uniref:M81 family metallopeptidase n=1 Tax=Microvirga pakistanensis TaxID=1682650 RepID=UPI00106D28FA|nr:M81 family metallopeptidase [Microvirga pakistanensis]
MPKVLVVECMQEISSFNPLPSEYENFHIERGEELYAQRGLNTAIGGALSVFEESPNISLVPVIGARAGSAGLLSAHGWQRLSTEILDGLKARMDDVNGIYVSLHGAMGADGELDPEGYLLSEIRCMVGPDVPIVISLDLHGILTDRMLRQIDGLAIYHTYPHVDFADTGKRAARLLLTLLQGGRRPVIARAVIPALVRGDELITRTGCYGDLIRECQRIERDGTAMAAGIMIGNPFTDVPELCTQVLVMTDGDESVARREAERLAQEFWQQRFRMQGKLIPLDRSIAQASTINGPVVFTDAADATSSGATGDSNIILKALRDAGYRKRVLAQIVDPPAAAAAQKAGVGATIEVTLGGFYDKKRFEPMPVRAEVQSLSNGRSQLETMKTGLDAGPTAVLTFDNFTVVVLSRTVSLFDRAMYYSNGLDPQDFDLIVVKSPHTEHHMYDGWVEKNFNIDAPGATSANLQTLGHTICARPMYPLDEIVEFIPTSSIYAR